MKLLPLFIIVTASVASSHAKNEFQATASSDPSRYNMVWETPSKDPFGSVPLGNGDIGINAWVQQDNDLQFYIGKTDAWGDNSRLLKVGKVRVKLSPNPFEKGNPYKQNLNLKNGELLVDATFSDGTPVAMKLWVDANHPVIHVSIDSEKDVQAVASIELWRTAQETLPTEVGDPLGTTDIPMIVEPDTLLKSLENRIGWYHHNKKSIGPEMTMKKQGLTDFKYTDSILHRTFGTVITAENGTRESDKALVSKASKAHRFSCYVLTRHPSSPEQWLESMNQLISKTNTGPWDQRYEEHKAWWRNFWERSWVHLEENPSATDGRSILKENSFPLILGRDQKGQNAFAGSIGRASIIDRSLSAKDVKKFAEGTRSQKIRDSGCLRKQFEPATIQRMPELPQSGSQADHRS